MVLADPLPVRDIGIQDQSAVIARTDHELVVIAVLTAEMHFVSGRHGDLQHLEIQVHRSVELGAKVVHLHAVRLETDLTDIFGIKIIVPSALLIELSVGVLP